MLIYKYKIKKNIKDWKDKTLNEFIIPDLIANSISTFLYNLNHKKIILEEQLKNLHYLDENISDVIYITFTRNNITYNKKAYIYLTKVMKDNLIKNNNMHSQFFQIAYNNVILSQIKNFKLYILIAFNNEKQKSELCSLVLINNENIETFNNIYQYLFKKYKFQPIKMKVERQKAHIISIQKIYPNCYIIICYFHIIRILVIHLPQIRSKNKESKELAKNLLTNMKILLFLPQRYIYQFFDLIKNRYYEIFPKFIKYFYKNFLWNFL